MEQDVACLMTDKEMIGWPDLGGKKSKVDTIM